MTQYNYIIKHYKTRNYTKSVPVVGNPCLHLVRGAQRHEVLVMDFLIIIFYIEEE